MKKLLRILFSRYTVSLLIILLELGCFVPSFWLAGGEIALALSTPFSVIAIVSVINRDANPEFKLTWIIVITFIPYLGTLIYVLFSRRRLSKREMKMYKSILPKISVNDRGESSASLESLYNESPLAATKARAILNDDFVARVCRKTEMKYYPTGEEMYSDMLGALSKAEHYIFLEYFIIAQGKMWDGIHELLLQKAKSGVEVRVLYDDVGSMGTVPNSFADTLRAEGIRCERFSPITPSVSAGHNNRDHRKIMIIDGRVAFTGGINIADEYINEKLRFGHWKDGGIRLMGDAVLPMLELFLVSWDKSSGKVSDWEGFKARCEAVKSDGGYYVPFSSGPLPIYRRPTGKNVFLNVINQAQKSVYITTPYLIIDYDLTESLRNASLRGVDVKIITPAVADKKLVKVMTKSSYKYLMDAGVGIYEYTPGFIHEKLLLSDGEYSVIGTINFDYRSLVHHFENAVWSYKSAENKRIEEGFKSTLTLCRKIEHTDAKLNLIEWAVKIIIRVFAPLL